MNVLKLLDGRAYQGLPARHRSSWFPGSSLALSRGAEGQRRSQAPRCVAI